MSELQVKKRKTKFLISFIQDSLKIRKRKFKNWNNSLQAKLSRILGLSRQHLERNFWRLIKIWTEGQNKSDCKRYQIPHETVQMWKRFLLRGVKERKGWTNIQKMIFLISLCLSMKVKLMKTRSERAKYHFWTKQQISKLRPKALKLSSQGNQMRTLSDTEWWYLW